MMEEESPTILDICIVGSGVAGLSAALSLQSCGYRVKVFERDFDFVDRKQGYGLTLTYSINGPLSKLGVLHECIANNCPSHCHYVFSPSGDVLGYYGRELQTMSEKPVTEQGGNRGNLRIPRQDLRMMLMRKLEHNTIQWGFSVMDYVESTENVSVSFQHHHSGSSETETVVVKSLIVVGADGIRSKLRHLRDMKHFQQIPASLPTPPVNSPASTISPIQYLGVAVIIGLSAASHAHINQRGFYVVDGENRMFTMPYITPHQSSGDATTAEVSPADSESCTSGQTMWQLSFSGLSEEEATALRRSSSDEILREALRRTAGWFAPVAEMIKATLPGELWATGLYDRDPMPQFAKDAKKKAPTAAAADNHTISSTVNKEAALADIAPTAGAGAAAVVTACGSRVTVIGDAAHPMSMFKGQGANQALADGPLLATWLSQGHSGSGVSKSAGAKRARQSEDKSLRNTGENTSADANLAVQQEEPTADEKMRNLRTALQNQSAVFTRLRCFEREMNARTTPKVLASREAARHLHSPDVLSDVFGISGVSACTAEENFKVLEYLRIAQVNASLGSELDFAMKNAIDCYARSI